MKGRWFVAIGSGILATTLITAFWSQPTETKPLIQFKVVPTTGKTKLWNPSTSSSTVSSQDSVSSLDTSLEQPTEKITPSSNSSTTTTPTVIPSIETTTSTTSTTEPISISTTQSVLEIALQSVGMSRIESGFSHFWCTEYTNWIFSQTGNTEWINKMASPGQQKTQMSSTEQPQAGDLLFISFFKNSQTDHVGVIESVNEDGSFSTIEGNGPDREFVARNTRYLDEITGFGNTHE